MKARYFLLLLSVVFFATLQSLDRCLAESQRYFHSEANGYSFTIPEGWKQIPEELVRQLYNKSLSVKARSMVLHEAEFQLKTEDTWFQGPTILVQVAKYSNFGLNRPPREDEFGDFVKSLTGIDVMEVKQKVWSKDVQNLISGATIGKATIDKENRSYIFVSEVKFSDSSKCRSEVVGYFGKESLVQLSFNYDTDLDSHRFSDDSNLVFASFRFDPLMAYRAPPRTQSFWEKLLVDAAVCGIIALAIALVGILYSVFRSKPQAEDKQQ